MIRRTVALVVFGLVFVFLAGASVGEGATIRPGDLVIIEANATGGVMLRVDPLTGAQEIITQGGGLGGFGSVVFYSGDILTVSSNGPSIIRVNPATGTRTVAFTGFTSPSSLALGPNGEDLYVLDGGASVIKINLQTGVRRVVTSGGNFVAAYGVAVNSLGDIYVTDSALADGKGGVVKVDAFTGAQTVLSRGGQFYDPTSIAVDPATGDLIVTDPAGVAHQGGGPGRVIRVNVLTGAQTVVLPSDGSLVDPWDLAIAPNFDWFISEGAGYIGPGRILRYRAGQGLTVVTSAGNLSTFGSTAIAIAPAGVGVSIPDTTATYGATITVPVRVENPSTPGIRAVDFGFAYDPSVVVSVKPEVTGSLLANWMFAENTVKGAGMDTLRFAATSTDSVRGVGTLVFLKVTMKDIRHPATAALKLVRVVFNEGQPAASPRDGSVRLVGTDAAVGSPDTVVVGKVIPIQITDADENRDGAVQESVRAIVINVNAARADSEVVQLTEGPPGVFSGTVPTSVTSSSVAGDNTLKVSAGDVVRVAFVDSLTASGVTTRREKTTYMLGGADGQVAATYVIQAMASRAGLRDTLRAQVTDPDLNVNKTGVDTAQVVLENTVTGEQESLRMLETGPNTNVFRGRMATAYGTAGVSNDGAVTVSGSDDIRVTYTDQLTFAGETRAVTAVTRVIPLFGDASGNGSITALDAGITLEESVGLRTPSARDSLVADLDGNVRIEAYDAALGLQQVVGLMDRFPVQSDTTSTSPSDRRNLPFLPKPVAAGRALSLGAPQMQEDGIALVPVRLEARDGIVAATFKVNVTAGMEVAGVSLGEGFRNYLMAYKATPEGVRIALAGAVSQAEGPGEVVWLRVRGGEASTRIGLEEAVLNGLPAPVHDGVDLPTVPTKAVSRTV